ncbi:hypothetical protein GCM10028808_56920 [Spirosoma migulaei]
MKLIVYLNVFSFIVSIFCVLGFVPDNQADQIVGRWQFPSRGSSVDIFRKGDFYFARVAEVDQAGEENFGLVKGAILILDLHYDGEVWTGGQLIHPKTGIHLSAEVHLAEPNAINVTIYKGIKLLHRKFTMTRQTRH